MRRYLQEHPWKIIEEGFLPDRQKSSESIFSLGNGHMGQRANFEEDYSGPTLQGNYIAGIYYPDKTRVGWWKNGYPEYFAKVLNAPSWIGINIRINGQLLDLNNTETRNFRRVLDMKEGILYRSFEAEFGGGEIIKVSTERFLSIRRRETGAISYSFKLIRGQAKCELESYLDGNIRNQDSNYDEKFWLPIEADVEESIGIIASKTKKTGFVVATSMSTSVLLNQTAMDKAPNKKIKNDRVGLNYELDLKESDTVNLIKIASILTSRDHPSDNLTKLALSNCQDACSIGYETLKDEQLGAWAEKWKSSDIVIEGDVYAQQGIRFSIFQLNQTYSGHDARLNIGPKGFTGEKYGGGTYWDTEAILIRFTVSDSFRSSS